jgi:hypothetical protein
MMLRPSAGCYKVKPPAVEEGRRGEEGKTREKKKTQRARKSRK